MHFFSLIWILVLYPGRVSMRHPHPRHYKKSLTGVFAPIRLADSWHQYAAKVK
jgi:hypothetical protein